MLITKSVNQIFQAEKDHTTALIEHPNTSTMYLEFGDATLNALKKIASLFDRTAEASKRITNITEDSHQPVRVQAPPNGKLIK